MEGINYENMARKLVDYVPELEEIYQHEIDYYGDISNYVFFGSLLTRFVFAHAEKAAEPTAADKELIERVFEYIENCAMSSDKEVLDVINAGFLEQILTYPNYQIVLGYMKAKTKEMLSTTFKL